MNLVNRLSIIDIVYCSGSHFKCGYHVCMCMCMSIWPSIVFSSTQRANGACPNHCLCIHSFNKRSGSDRHLELPSEGLMARWGGRVMFNRNEILLSEIGSDVRYKYGHFILNDYS